MPVAAKASFQAWLNRARDHGQYEEDGRRKMPSQTSLSLVTALRPDMKGLLRGEFMLEAFLLLIMVLLEQIKNVDVLFIMSRGLKGI